MTGPGDFRKWLREDWTHQMAFYFAVVVTLSLLVQVIATVILARLT